MTPQDIVRHFGTKTNAARSLGISRRTLQYWAVAKSVPAKQQFWIEFETGGKLKAARK